MHDARSQQRVLSQDLVKPVPGQPVATGAAAQPFMPDTTYVPKELPDAAVVRRASVVLVMAAEFGVQGFLLLAHRVVPVPLAPVGNRLEPSAGSLVDCLHVHCEFPFPAAGADVGKTEEVEGLEFLSTPLRIPLRIASEFNQPRLLRVKRQTEIRKTFR